MLKVLSFLFIHLVCIGSETKALEIMRESLKVEGPFSVDLLSGGYSGSKVLKVTTNDQAFVVRFWNRQWSEYFWGDLTCQLIASKAGYGPRVFFADEKEYVTIMQYLHPEPFPKTQIRLKAMVELLKKIHDGPPVPKGIDKFIDLDESLEEVARLNLQCFDINNIRAIKETILEATLPGTCCVPCHRDLHPGNLIYTQNQFFAIDYTWCGMDDPYIDLATLAMFHCRHPEEEQLLLNLYLGRDPSSEEIARLSLMKLLSKIFYGLEFLKLVPESSLDSTVAITKSYLNFGMQNESLDSHDFLEYAVSMLSEVIDYSRTEKFIRDLNLLNP